MATGDRIVFHGAAHEEVRVCYNSEQKKNQAKTSKQTNKQRNTSTNKDNTKNKQAQP